ncbi:NAD(P)-dependent dehydrogenase (short-subunit alcohol dehydrogenase family) [Pedobacter cryoconitis]|uniref:SDR family NAD(P)-dependent oxidoreductase n=1 Tax=Pedobacter cryoconitis TaxID=188932 RepID=UPI0018083C89|nr:SDR family NAD(P)-dependent oxidoreductase [Pedobacter cryoconitis]MBB6272438.1 NAD(P)-dependent dehydrogenase (short-subunit alcohol dehydrogenase family) [Pedobacter cryoconitis]
MKSNNFSETHLPVIQCPVDTEFNAASTAEEVISGIDLSGKTAIVTGGYSGIGLETVRVLSAAGARIIVPARDYAKASKALKNIKNVEIEEMELMNPVSVDAFANKFLASGRPLHILVNSAGIMAVPLQFDAKGYESQFSTNHLGHFQLTLSLWPALMKANGARVVSVSSRGHRYSPVVFEDLNFENREYIPLSAYGQSKTANILFALELDKRGKANGIRAFSVHPGTIVNTNLGRYLGKDDLFKAGIVDEQGNPVLDPLRQMKTVEQGASTSIWCATSPMLEGIGGVYCENNNIASIVTNLVPDPLSGADAKGNFGVMPHAVDSEIALQLWKLSEKITGVSI